VDELLLAWYQENGRELPWRQTTDPYAILVSEVMAQQTQIDRVVPRWARWLERWPTVEGLAEASPADVIREWQGLGYNRRALSLHRAAQTVAANGWPDDLTELPGVGRYTADAVARFALDRDVLPVDVNVRRVQERTRHAFTAASAQALMDLGATVCRARIPRCDVCPLAAGCPSRGSRYEPLRKLVSTTPGGHAPARCRRGAASSRPRSGRRRVARAGRARARHGRHRVTTRLVRWKPCSPPTSSPC
jgi:A/G-specific adenine glycosylase